ncbi:PadR family transcriptional regulator [Dactylosporangium sp. NPDC048998]|uniref:PadR family transcriptional regulator n=1 Tax=Dactylosporangium sp. NPDC048998 TaxID=3363976 RepID=UPI003722A8DF
MPDDELVSAHLQELRRGTVVLACLLILERPNYGYALLDQLERSGFAVDANTLYPLLRRLEKQGLLTSDWNTEESRPRKFYRTSDQGKALADALRRDWDALDGAFRALNDDSALNVSKGEP